MTTNVLLARFDRVPSLVAPEHRARFEASLAAVVGHPRAPDLLSPQMSEDGFWFAADDWRSAYRPYIVRDGILHIPVKGVLLHDFPWAFGSWSTGYVYIRRAFDRGLADPSVQGIALVCDSPGGQVAGNFELVDHIFAARGQKPIRAFAHESAYSGAYSIASAADSITMSRTGGVGSIGVVTAHIDFSEALKEYGVKVTFIFAGQHKVDGNAYEPLPDSVKARIQEHIDDAYGVFVAAVARNRGMDEAAVRETEADCFMAAEAVANGLADTIGPLDDAMATFVADLSRADETEGDDEMSNAKPAAGDAATTATKPAASNDAAANATNANTTAARAEGEKTGQAVGAQAERTRVAGILGCEEAKGREGLAQHFAFNTGMSVDDAKAALSSAPKQEAATPKKTGFEAAMDAVRNPQVGATSEDNGGDDVSKASAAVHAYLGTKTAA